MPLYRYGCAKCKREEDGFNSVADRHKAPVCCSSVMGLVIMPTMVQTDLPGYQSPVTGKWIEGRAARREDLARTGSRPWEGRAAEEKEAARQRVHEEAKDDAKLEAVAQSAYSQLSPEKREILRNPGPAD